MKAGTRGDPRHLVCQRFSKGPHSMHTSNVAPLPFICSMNGRAGARYLAEPDLFGDSPECRQLQSFQGMAQTQYRRGLVHDVERATKRTMTARRRLPESMSLTPIRRPLTLQRDQGVVGTSLSGVCRRRPQVVISSLTGR